MTVVPLFSPPPSGSPVRPHSAMNKAATSSRSDFKVADLALADWGRKEIELAEVEMPGLMALREEYRKQQPLEGARISGSLARQPPHPLSCSRTPAARCPFDAELAPSRSSGAMPPSRDSAATVGRASGQCRLLTACGPPPRGRARRFVMHQGLVASLPHR